MKSSSLLIAASLVIGSVALVSWAGNPDTALPHFSFNDTLPQKLGTRDFDHELQQIEKAKESLHKINAEDMQKMMKDVEESIAKIDLQKIELDAQKAMKEIDFTKIEKQLQEAMQNLDEELISQEKNTELSESKKKEIKNDLENARKEIKEEMEKLKKELKEQKIVTQQEMRKGLEDAKKDMEKAKQEMKENRFDMEKEIAKAKVEVDNAMKEVRGYQEMVYAMEEDGLLSTKQDYTIEHKNGEISINGKTLNESSANKYKKYFKNKDMKIEKKDGKINIRNEKDKSVEL